MSWGQELFPYLYRSSPSCSCALPLATPPLCSTVSDIPQYSELVLSVCGALQEQLIALFDQTRQSLATGSSTEDKDSMETDDSSRTRSKDQRDGVSSAR